MGKITPNKNYNDDTPMHKYYPIIRDNIDAICSAHNAEIDDRTAADNALQGKINTEAAERKSADNILQNNIASEANFRQISDNALQSGINNEKTARENADNAHKNAVELDHPNGSVTEVKLSAAAQAKLNHNNREVLDGITADRVTKWDTGGEIPEEGVKYHHLSYPLEQNIVQVVRGTVIPGDNGNPGTFVVDPNINDIDFHRGGMFIAEFTGIIEKFTYKENDYFVVNGDYDSVGADGELQFWLFHINTGITDAGTKDVSPILQLDGDKYGTKKYNVSDIMDTNNFFEFPGNTGAYIYLTNDTATEISYLYYNDDVGYSFTVPLQPGKTYPCLLIKDATSTIDGSEDGRIYVVGQGGIDHYMIKSAAVQGNNIAPGAVSLEKFATDVQNKITAWDAAANTTIDDLSGVFCHDFGNVVFNKQIDPDWAEPENQYNTNKRGVLREGDIVRFRLSSIKSESGADEAETGSLSINVGYYSNYLNLLSGEPFKVGHDYVAIVSQSLTWYEEQGAAGADGEAHIILDDWKTQGAGGSANITKNNNSPTGDIISSHLTIGSRKGYSERTLSVGENNWTFGENQVAFGSSGYSRGKNSGVLFGENCTAGDSSRGNNAAGGLNVSANGERSCAFGGYQNSVAWKSTNGAILGGQNNIVWGTNSAIIAGGNNIINENGNNSFCSGEYLIANRNNFVAGRYNISPQDGNTVGGSLLTIGCGTSDANRSNAMRVDNTGNVYAKTTINATGADYAELWEWADGNPDEQDRAGYFATMDGNKIRLSQDGDNLARVGVISGNPAIIGDNYADEWCGKYLRDIYGRYLRERVSYPEIKNENGNVIQQAYEADELILNPNYNPNEAYIPREQRKEYDFLGTHGKLVVRDDGSCEANGFCRPTNGGIATAAESGYHVMERIDENHIRVYVK